jgi:hypothetical protein
MKSRVVGIIKFEASSADGLNYSGRDGLSLEKWLSALVGDDVKQSPARWQNRQSVAFAPRRVRADLKQLADQLDREYLALAAG